MIQYCLDTNIYIEPRNKYYSMDLCPWYWEYLDKLAKDKVIFSPIEVKNELILHDDKLSEWVKKRPYFFRDIDIKTQENLIKILKKYPWLINTIKNKSMADPWVVACAMNGNTTVVTKESPSQNIDNKPKIPDVCSSFNIKVIDDYTFLKEIWISFSIKNK